MLFELQTNTECELTTFVGRTQKSGPDDVPAVTFRLKLTGVSNALLDRFSKTIRHTVYKAVEGQDQLPGVEDTTPLLQSKDLAHWAPETCLEGWQVFIARGISDGGALQMGSCKVDNFRFDFFEGGRMDVDFRVSTADVDEEGAGMLWGRQKRKVFATIIAPEMPEAKPVIDGSKAAFEADHPEAGDLFADGAAGVSTLAEWVDVIILAFDGAWRGGATPEQIVAAIVAKQTKNEGRRWPDWRTADHSKAIEHDRSGEVSA